MYKIQSVGVLVDSKKYEVKKKVATYNAWEIYRDESMGSGNPPRRHVLVPVIFGSEQEVINFAEIAFGRRGYDWHMQTASVETTGVDATAILEQLGTIRTAVTDLQRELAKAR